LGERADWLCYDIGDADEVDSEDYPECVTAMEKGVEYDAQCLSQKHLGFKGCRDIILKELERLAE